MFWGMSFPVCGFGGFVAGKVIESAKELDFLSVDLC